MKLTELGKKRFLVLLVLAVVLLTACKKAQEQKNEEMPEKKTALSELQTEACNSADMAKTCDTRLQELGIVLKEDCCEALGKCC